MPPLRTQLHHPTPAPETAAETQTHQSTSCDSRADRFAALLERRSSALTRHLLGVSLGIDQIIIGRCCEKTCAAPTQTRAESAPTPVECLDAGTPASRRIFDRQKIVGTCQAHPSSELYGRNAFCAQPARVECHHCGVVTACAVAHHKTPFRVGAEARCFAQRPRGAAALSFKKSG